GEIGVAVGYEKMRNNDGKMEADTIGRALGHFSHQEERDGKIYVFPHLFAEVMRDYLSEYRLGEIELARIAELEYANARHNPCAQMRTASIDRADFYVTGERNRYLVNGLPLKTFDCSQITDGYAAVLLATADGVARLGIDRLQCVELAG